MIRWIVSTVALGALVAGGFPAAGAQEPAQVKMSMFMFEPAEITVEPGTTVVWTNAEDYLHTATSGWDDGKTFDYPLEYNEKAEWKFSEPGTYKIVCTPHSSKTNGEWEGMTGLVVVAMQGAGNETGPGANVTPTTNETPEEAGADRVPGIAVPLLVVAGALAAILAEGSRRAR